MAAIPPITAYPMPGRPDLPENTAGWEPDPDRAVLLIHDMQRFFLRPFPEEQPPRRELVENIARLRTRCAGRGVPVAYTEQPGSMSEDERGLLRDFWGPGMRRAPEDRAVAEPLTPAVGDWRLTKWRYSAFHRSDLHERMRAAGRDQLVLCGVYAHVGVLMTAVDAFSRDIEVFLIGDAVADFSAHFHHLALSYAALRCARVETTDWALDRIDGEARVGTAGSAL